MSASERNAGEWLPHGGWDAWLEGVDLMVWEPRPVFARPATLAALGRDSYIVEPYEIHTPERVWIGDNVSIAERCSFAAGLELPGGGPVLTVGSDVTISFNLVVESAGRVEIGDGVGISARASLGGSNPDGEPTAGTDSDVTHGSSGVRIGAGALVGVGAAVLDGVTVGERALVAAGSVVTRDVPARAVVFGNPARVIRSWDEETGGWRTGG